MVKDSCTWTWITYLDVSSWLSDRPHSSSASILTTGGSGAGSSVAFVVSILLLTVVAVFAVVTSDDDDDEVDGGEFPSVVLVGLGLSLLEWN